MEVVRGHDVPHFEVGTIDGAVVRYADLWQRRNLILVLLPGETSADERPYVAALTSRRAEFEARDATVVLTRSAVEGLAAPAVVVADRWGEVIHVASPAGVVQLPGVDEIIEWLDYTRMRCPECEGETR